jgi:hypothetical protein
LPSLTNYEELKLPRAYEIDEFAISISSLSLSLCSAAALKKHGLTRSITGIKMTAMISKLKAI